MNNSFLNRFTPKQIKFYPMFNSLADILITASELLMRSVESKEYSQTAGYFNQIKELEHQGDELSQRIFEELNSTFITPFDREDINNIAIQLYENIHGINSCAKRIALYQPRQIPAAIVQLAQLARNATENIDKAVKGLDNLKKDSSKIKEYCSQLHAIEIEADDVYEYFIKEIFSTEKDPVELIKLKEISNELENTTDYADILGKTIRNIIVKYA